MTTADVNKLACRFVEDMLTYLSRQKFVTDLCLDSVKLSFSEYKLITTLEDCLSYKDICDLLGSVVNQIPEPEIETINCGEQISVTVTATTNSCHYFEQVRSHIVDFDAFPAIVLQEDSIYQKAYINIMQRSDCGGLTGLFEVVESGCWSNLDTGPIDCNSDYDYAFEIDYRINGLLINQDGYIKTIRFYETDSNGLLINIPFDLDVSPANVSSWVGCLLCSGVDPNDLYFSSPNWVTAFNQLLQNISFTRYGSLLHKIRVRKSGSDIVFVLTVKHKPASEWMGLYTPDFKVDWVNNDGATITNTTPGLSYGSSNEVRITQDYSIPTPCGQDITGRYRFSSFFSNGLPSSRFNELKINNFKFNSIGEVVNVNQVTCNTTTLVGSFTILGTGEVLDYGWINSSDEIISNELTVTVTESDTYRFFVQLDNGCQIQKTITV